MTKPMPGNEPDPMTAQRKTSTADLIDAVNGLNSHIKKLRVWIYCTILALVAVGIVCIIIVLSYNRLSTASVNAKQAIKSQKCINNNAEDRYRRSVELAAAEYTKVNNQYIGVKKVRDSSKSGDQMGVVNGFNIFIDATKEYRDSEQIAGFLRDNGVTIQHHRNGTVSTSVPKALPATAC